MTTPVENNPNRLGVIAGDNQGYPNGRRLGDDVIDISLRVAEGVLVDGHDPQADNLGDGVDENDVAFSDEFPYLALPARGSDQAPHDGAGRGNSPGKGTADNGAAAPTSGSSGSSGFSVPVLPSTALALGLLALMAGVVGLVRRPRRQTV